MLLPPGLDAGWGVEGFEGPRQDRVGDGDPGVGSSQTSDRTTA